jgi:hypothetical protein
MDLKSLGLTPLGPAPKAPSLDLASLGLTPLQPQQWPPEGFSTPEQLNAGTKYTQPGPYVAPPPNPTAWQGFDYPQGGYGHIPNPESLLENQLEPALAFPDEDLPPSDELTRNLAELEAAHRQIDDREIAYQSAKNVRDMEREYNVQFGEPQTQEEAIQKGRDQQEYYEALPLPITADVLRDEGLTENYRQVNEIITGKPLATTPREEMATRQAWIDSQKSLMELSGITDPVEWVQKYNGLDDESGFAGRTASAYGQGIVSGLEGLTSGPVEAVRDMVLPEEWTQGPKARNRTEALKTSWAEGEAAQKDKQSAIGEFGASVTRAAGLSLGQQTPALLLGPFGGTSGVLAGLGTQVASDTYNNARAQGWGKKEAFAYSAATAGIEVLTERIGLAASKAMGWVNLNEAFTPAAKKTFAEAMKRTGLSKLKFLGGAGGEGTEEIIAEVLNSMKDQIAGIDPELFGSKPASEQVYNLSKVFATGALAGLAGNVPAAIAFVLDPNRKTAKDAGVDPRAFDQETLEEIAAAVAQAVPEAVEAATQPPVDPAAPLPTEPFAPVEGAVITLPEEGVPDLQLPPQLATTEDAQYTMQPGAVPNPPAQAPPSPTPNVPGGTPVAVDPNKWELDGITYGVEETSKGWVAYRVQDGIRTQKGGDPRTGGFSQQAALDKMTDEMEFDLKGNAAAKKELQEVTDLVNAALPKANAKVERGDKGDFKVSFPNGASVRLKMVEQVPATEKEITKGLADYQIEDTPENRKLFQANIRGKFQLAGKDGAAVIHLRTAIGAEAPDVLRHEAVHFARQSGMIDDAEWNKLLDSIDPSFKDLAPKAQEEVLARHIQKNPRGTIATKIREVYAKVLELMGVDAKAADKLEEAMRTGSLFAKPAESGQEPAKSGQSLTDHFSRKLMEGGKYENIVQARKEAEEITGKPIKPGTAESKAVDEAVEVGVVNAARQIIKDTPDKAEAFDKLVDLYQRQPRLASRSSTSAKNQAYSTPAPLAFAAQMLAGVTPEGKTLDTSAGNGMLLTAADPKNAYANELEKARFESLQQQGLNVTQGDATTMEFADKVDSLVINPPFNKVSNGRGGYKTFVVDDYKTKKIDHAITLKSLKFLKDDGKAVIIIGSTGFGAGKPLPDSERAYAYSSSKGFFDRVYDNYNVVDHFTVDGKLYARQGASFPVDVIVVDGKGKSARSRPWNFQEGGLPQVITSWEELKNAKLTAINTPVASPADQAPSAGGVGNNADVGESDASAPSGDRSGVAGRPGPDRDDNGSVGGKDGKSPRVREPRVDSGSSDVPGQPSGQPGPAPGRLPEDAGNDGGGRRDKSEPGGAFADDSIDAAIEAEFKRQEEAENPAPKKKPAAKNTMKVFQGRGATLEEIYGEEAVKDGRAVPLFGPGQYYAEKREDAKNYGNDITEHEIALNQPYLLDSDLKWRWILEKSGADHLDNMGPKFYQDPQGVPAATQKLQDYIKSLGYDGVIVKLRGEETRRLEAMAGHDQVVVFGKAKPAKKPAKAAGPKREGHHPQSLAWAKRNKSNYENIPSSVMDKILDGMDAIFDAHPEIAKTAEAVPGYTVTTGNLLEAASILDYIIEHGVDNTAEDTFSNYDEGDLTVQTAMQPAFSKELATEIDYKGSTYGITHDDLAELLNDDLEAYETLKSIESWMDRVDESHRPKPPRKPPKDKKPSTTQDDLAKAKAEAAAALKALLDGFKAPPGSTPTSTGIDPEHVKRAVTLARALTKVGILEFKAFVEYVQQAAPEMLDQLAPYLEGAWRYLHKTDTTGTIGPAGKVSDIIGVLANADLSTKTEVKRDKETEFQKDYTPRSKRRAVGTLLPANQVAAIAAALENVEAVHGDIDAFVQKELGFTDAQMDDFSAEQVDALGLAIANDKKGEAFIIGDQTGIGKGRIVAAMIHYAKKKGLVPVFVTEKPSLYADMMRDLTDIGLNPASKEFNPLITDKLGGKDIVDLNNNIKGRGKRLAEQGPAKARKQLSEAVANHAAGKGLVTDKGKAFDAIFTTYNQISPYLGQENSRVAELRKIIKDAYFILDESHNAGGTEKKRKKDEDDEKVSRAEIVRDLLSQAANVFFSSATFAKRSQVMDLYSRAGIGRALKDITKLPELMKKGGVPLQQVLSNMLAEAGLYLRRERSFDGIEFEPAVAEVDLSIADKASESFRLINDFSNSIQEALIKIKGTIISGGGKTSTDKSTGSEGVKSTHFASIFWNINSQMLFALKADAAADAAIAAWKSGESPVIAVDQTMETKLKEFLSANGYKEGDLTNYSFRDLIRNYLERSREISYQTDRDDKDSWVRYRLTDDELGEVGLANYNRALAIVNKFDAELPASPIDWIRYRLEQAGMSVAEITGRRVQLDYSSGLKTPTVKMRDKSELGTAGKQKSVNDFNEKKLDALILNRSGSTGLSIHNSTGVSNDNRRHMIIAEPAQNIDEFMQMLGRIHRTGQRRTVERNGKTVTALPRYTLFMTNAPAENRPAAVLVKKLASLNANVTASAKGSVSFDVPDIINAIGDQVVGQWAYEHRDLNAMMGYPARERETGSLEVGAGIAKKVSGMVGLLPVKIQEAFWNDIVEAYAGVIAELDAIGANPLVARTLDLQAKTVERTIIAGDSAAEGDADPFRQPAYLDRVMAKPTGKPMNSIEIVEELDKFWEGKDRPVWGKELAQETRREAAAWVTEREATIRERKPPKDAKPEEIIKHNAKTESMVKSMQKTATDQMETVQDWLTTMGPGKAITINIGTSENPEIIHAIVLGVKHKGKKGENPLALSKWVADLAVAHSARRLHIPLSRLATTKMAATLVGIVRKESFSKTPLAEMFDDLQTDQREERYIGTGNVLTAFEHLSDFGAVTFYTDSDGNKKSGILLPKKFDVEKWMGERPYVFKTPAELLRFLQKGGQAAAVDNNLIVHHFGDNIVLVANANKVRGGKYYTSDTLMAASGTEFFKKGNRFEMLIPPGRAQEATLKALMDITSIQTRNDKELINSLGAENFNSMTAGLPPELPWQSYVNPTRQTRSKGARMPGDVVEEKAIVGDGVVVTTPAQKKQAIAAQDIAKTLERIFGVPLRQDGFNSKRAAGRYYTLTEVVRTKEKYVAALGVLMHEIGHHIDKHTGVGRRKTTNIPDALQNELAGLDYEPQAARLFEGWAEFVRMWVTETGMVEKKAPRFTKWFETKWLPANPELAKKLKEAQKYCRQFADQSVFLRLQSLFGGPAEDLSWAERFKAKMNTGVSDAITRQVDKYYAIDVLSRELKDRGYAGLSPYDVIMHYDGTAQSHAQSAIENGVKTLDGRHLGGPALGDIKKYVNSAEEWEEAKSYALARHTLWSHKRDPQYNTTMDPADALVWVSRMEKEGKKDRYDEVAKIISDYGDSLLDMLVEARVIRPELAEKLKKEYDGNYFPLIRVKEDQPAFRTGKGMFNLRNPLRRRSKLGSGRKIMDPIDALMDRSVHDYNRAIKQRGAMALAQALMPEYGGIEGMGKDMVKVDPPRKVTFGVMDDVLNKAVEAGFVDEHTAKASRIAYKVLRGDSVSAASKAFLLARNGFDPLSADAADLKKAAGMEPDAATVIAIWRPDYSPNPGKKWVQWTDMMGDQVLVEMDDMLYEVATGLNQKELGKYIKILRSVGEWFKLGAVKMSTFFATANLITDYVGYQGRAEQETGLRTLTSPIALLGQYIAAKSFGGPNALVELFEETGGSLYSSLSDDVKRKRLRRSLVAPKGSVFTLSSLADFAGRVKEGLQFVTAASDVPVRLSEMRASLRKNGYTYKGGIWYDTTNNTPVKDLPEYARIQAGLAAANASVNFKRSGTSAGMREAFLPLSTAGINALYRHAGLLANLKNAASKGEKGQRARRYAIYLTALAVIDLGYMALRGDEDDYLEAEEHDRRRYWLFGSGGVTTFRIPKPRDEAVFLAVVESLWSRYGLGHDEAPSVGKVLAADALDRLPAGGGPGKALVEIWGNYNSFRGRAIVPEYLKDVPEAYQYDQYTLETSKAIGKYTGIIGLGPMEIEHLLDSTSGGAFRRFSDLGESAWNDYQKGEVEALGAKNIPFVGRMFPNRKQAGSVTAFYDRLGELSGQAYAAKEEGTPNEALERELSKYNSAATLMAAIRDAEPKDYKGRRGYSYQQYIVGLARETMHLEPLESNPSPFADAELPPKLAAAVEKKATHQAEVAMLSHGRPEVAYEGKTFDQGVREWLADRNEATRWLKAHKDSPIIQSVAQKMLKDPRFLKARNAKIPRRPSPKTLAASGLSLADYRAYQVAGWSSDRDQAKELEKYFTSGDGALK